MAAIAAVSLNDGQTTPIAHTYTPTRRINDMAVWVNRENPIAVYQPVLTTVQLDPKQRAPNPSRKQTTRLMIPRVAVVDGKNVIVNRCFVEISATVPEDASAAEIADLIAYAKQLPYIASWSNFLATGDRIL